MSESRDGISILPVQDRVMAICRDVLSAPTIGLEDTLESFGASSLSRIMIASRLSTEFGLEFPPTVLVELLFNSATTRALCARVVQAGGGGVAS